MTTMNYQQALKIASGICSKSEKCCAEIVIKFQEWGLSEDEINNGIDYLIKEKFIDEKRYALNFVHDKFRFNKWGKIKIAYMLRSKKIPEEMISQALESIADDDYERLLRNLLQAKVRSIKSTNDLEGKAKLVYYARQRGFENEIAYLIANNVFVQD